MCYFRMELNTINFFWEFSIIVSFELLVEAIILKDFGNFTTASSWLIQTVVFLLKNFLLAVNDFFVK